jgi:predicted AlkP superfamily phosphohydrolase/phosphomutase
MRGRTPASAALAGALFAANLVVLTLYLNPELTPTADAVPLLVGLLLPYAVAATATFALLALLGNAFRWWPRAFGPMVPGYPWAFSLSFLAVAATAFLFWYNLLSYRHSIPVAALRGLFGSCLAITGALLTLLGVAVDALVFPHRPRSVSAALAVLAPAATLAIPLALRPAPQERPAPVPVATDTVRPVRRVILVGVDGLGPAQVEDGIAGGSLAAFGRLARRGASGPLATLRPTEGPPVWTSIVTGCLPRDHGIKSFSTYRVFGSARAFELLPKGVLVAFLERAGLVSRRPVTSAARRRPALWDALGAFGIASGTVRIWGTHPPEKVQGFMLSPYFHLLSDDPARATTTLFPPDLWKEVLARAVRPGEVDPALVREFVDDPAGTGPWRRPLVDEALAPDLTYHRAGALLRSVYDPALFATNVNGLDVAGHAFFRYAHPDRFGDVRPADARRFGRVLERYQALVGQWVGELGQGLRPGEVLLVVSGFGMEPVSLWRRLLVGFLGGEPASGTHAGAPDGYLLAVGDGIRADAHVERASVLDIAPTVLYLFGLPVARDMEGRVLTEIVDPDFASRHAVTFIPSYESLAISPLGVEAPLEDLPPLLEEGP